MTIYDSDYVATENLQAQYQTAGVKDPVAVDQEASQQEVPVAQAEPVQPAEPSDKDYNFKALRDELAQIKEDRDRLRGDFEDLRRSNVQRQPEPPRKRAIDEINPDDLVTGAQFKQAMQEREAEYQLMLGELQVKSQNTDYDEVTAKYGIPLIENDPDLAQGFLNANAASRASYLYKMGKFAQEQEAYRALIANQSQPVVQQAPQVSESAKRMVANASKPGTLSQPTGGAGNLSQVDYIASMSDKDFYAMVQKNLNEI